jgi:hypothetical protein
MGGKYDHGYMSRLLYFENGINSKHCHFDVNYREENAMISMINNTKWLFFWVLIVSIKIIIGLF